jgi:hypothetical protein
MLPEDQMLPGRLTIWTADDLAAWSDLLRKAFPQVLFHEEFRHDLAERNPEKPPTVVFRQSLADIRHGMGQILIPAPGWRPELIVAPGESSPYWRWSEPPHISGCYGGRGSGGLVDIQMPGPHRHSQRISPCDVYFRYHRHDLEAKAMVQKALRLINKMATNKLLLCDEKTLVVKRPVVSGMYWAGHHAIRWCLGDPRRTLYYWYLPLEAESRGPGPDIPGEIALINKPIRARAADELVYASALRRAFPGIRFIDGPLWWRHEPTLRFIDGIVAADSAEVSLLFPSDDWRPQFARSAAGHWVIANRPFPHGTFTRSSEVTGRMWSTDWKHLDLHHGFLRFEWPADLASAKAVAHEAISLSPPSPDFKAEVRAMLAKAGRKPVGR